MKEKKGYGIERNIRKIGTKARDGKETDGK